MTDANSNYIHSRVMTTVIDNSIADEVVTIPVEFVLYQPYFSDEGEDNVLRSHDYETSFVAETGKPNIKKHGQQIYNAIQWLKGGGKVLGLRLTAEDSKPAFGVLNIRTKVISELNVQSDGETPVTAATTGLMISPTFVPVPASVLTSAVLALPEKLMMKQIANAIQSDADAMTSAAGWTDHFLTFVKKRGRGKFGNNFGVTLTLDQTREDDIEDSRRYFFQAIKKDSYGNVTSVSDLKSVSFNPVAVDPTGTVSEFLDTVIESDEYKKVFTGFAVYTNEEVYEELLELFAGYTGEVTNSDGSVIISPAMLAKDIDFLYLIDKEGDSYKRFLPISETEITAMVTATDVPEINFGEPNAFLTGGNDGALDAANYTIGGTGPGTYADKKAVQAAITAVKTALMVKAYQGKVDSNILSPYKYQISAVIDADNAADVKKEMVYLCRKRLDIIAYVDCGHAASCAAAINFRKTILTGFTDWNMSIWPQSGSAWDSYNKQNIDVTYCYDIAYKMPYLRKNYGPNRLMAGTDKGAIATVNVLNWIPDEDQKTELLKQQMNYIEEVRLNQFAIMSNRTAYLKRLSYLAVIRNVHAICESIWVGRQVLTDLRFEEDPDIAQTKAKESITRNLQYLINNGPVERLIVKTEQTTQDRYENSASAYVEMKFTDFIHTWKFYVVAAR